MLSVRLVAWSILAFLTLGPALAQQQPSPSHLAVAREVATLSGMTRTFDAILPQFGEQIRRQAVTRPELTKDLDDVLVKLRPELELQKQVIITGAAKVMAQALTEAELKDIAAFFRSPSGKRYVEMQPQVLDGMVREMEVWTQSVSEYMMIRVRAEMSKRGHELQ